MSTQQEKIAAEAANEWGGCGHETVKGLCMWCGAYLGTDCIVCKKKDLDTEEGSGTECQLADGNWVCSEPCWEWEANRVEGAPEFRKSHGT